ncbi:hypothetical protein ABLA30_15875 [Xenorhabdus nematophila]|uniref:hypothetical protein n=1 Tax=Xenorhabdus nematophila TaxID=628 RepID=UPI0032B86F52
MFLLLYKYHPLLALPALPKKTPVRDRQTFRGTVAWSGWHVAFPSFPMMFRSN